MHANDQVSELPVSQTHLDFQTSPERYRHWQLSFDGPIAELKMDVDENAGMFPGYELKLNSYDIGVDIELYDAIQRLRFEHPEVKTVIVSSAKDTMFCAGANIRMLAGAAHDHKVNFCKFTNETRNSIEDASKFSGQRYLCAINGTAAGGGYELALAADYLILIDDGNAAVSLPEIPLLAVLPGTGGLTRLVDKRKVRRDLSDVFCTVEEGVKGKKAVDWRLIDETVPTSKFAERVREKAQAMVNDSDRPDNAKGVQLEPLVREINNDNYSYSSLRFDINRQTRTATLIIKGPADTCVNSIDEIEELGDQFWPLALARELDDALLHLRFNEPTIGTLVIKSEGDVDTVLSYDSFLHENSEHWLVREILLFWKRTLKRLDVTSRTLFAFIEPGSCFAGFLAELIFAVDRSYMLEGQFENDDRDEAVLVLTQSSFGSFPMSNDLSRLESRFYGETESVGNAEELIGKKLDAAASEEAGLVTFSLDDIDWEDEVRMLVEERASFSPDALIGMEANLRFVGPETMETKIFGRPTAWQNWIFQRPNAVSDEGALRLYGTGTRADFDKKRV